jgi:hypothetical protein
LINQPTDYATDLPDLLKYALGAFVPGKLRIAMGQDGMLNAFTGKGKRKEKMKPLGDPM